MLGRFGQKQNPFWKGAGLCLTLLIAACGAQPTEDIEGLPAGMFTPKNLVVSPTGPSSNNNPSVGGIAQAASTVTLFSDCSCTTSVGTGVANSLGAFSIAVAVLSDSSTTFCASATDGVTTSACSTASVIYVEDSTAPGQPTVSATNPVGPKNNNSPVVTGTSEASAVVSLYSDAPCTTVIGSGSANGSGGFSVPVTVSDNSTTTIYGKATDLAGNVSGCSSTSVSYVEDSVIPAQPVLVNTTPLSPANNNNPAINGTALANSTIIFYSSALCVTSVASGLVNAGGTFAIPVAVSDNTTRWIYARTVSPAGTPSSCTTSPLIYVEDSAPPAAPVLGSTAPVSPANNNSPTLNGTAEANSSVTVYTGAACTTALSTFAASGSGTFTLPLTVLDNTTNTYYATATDASGNISACSAVRNYVEDSTAPAAPVLTGTSPVSPRNNNNPAVSGTTEASATVTLFSDAACATSLASGTANGSGVFSIATPVVNDTSTTIYAKAVDTSGNPSSCSVSTLTYVEDSTAPSVPVLSSTTPAGPANNNSPVVNGTGEASASILLYNNATCTTSLGSGTISGVGTFAVTIAVANDSTTNVYAKSTDVALNSSACTTASLTYVESSAGPPPPVMVGSTPLSPANNNSPTIVGTAAANITVTLFSNAACTTTLAGGPTNGTGNFSIAISVANDTSTVVYGRAYDVLGNPSVCSTTNVTYLEDSTGPVLNVVSVSPVSPANYNVPVVAGTTDANSTVALYTNSGCTVALSSGAANGSGNFTVTISAADNTTTTIYGNATDVSGNLGACTSTALNFIEDSASPAAPIVSSATPTGPANNNAPVITGTAEAIATVSLFSNNTCSTALASGVASGIGSFTVTISVANNTTTNVYGIATDVAGNASGCSTTTVPYVEDSTPPAAPALVSTTPTGPANNNSPTVNGTAEANNTVTLFSDATCTTVIGSGASNGLGNFSVAASVADNTTTSIFGLASDPAGNTSACSLTPVGYVEDSLGPAAPTFGLSTPNSPANNNSPVINGTTENNAPVALYSNAACTASLATGTANGAGAFTIAISVLNDTSTSVYATAMDGAGNVSACSATPVTYVEDSTAPSAPTLTGTSPNSPANNNAPAVLGTAENNAAISLFSNAACTITLSSGTASALGAISIAISVTDNTTTGVYANATDASGNISACSLSPLNYIEDSVAPAIPVISGTTPALRSSKQAVTLDGTAEAASTISVFSNSICTTAVTSGTTSGGGTFNVAMTGPWNTNVTYYAKATDAAGNASACSSTSAVYEAYTIGVGVASLKGTQTTAPTTPTNLNQATAYSMQWSSSDFDYDYYTHSTTALSHQLAVRVAGDYLVALTLPGTAATAATNIITEVRVNGVVNTGSRAQPFYMANTGGHTESSINMAILLPGLAANDIVDVTVLKGGAVATVTITGTASLYVEYIAPARTIFRATATQTVDVTAPTNFNQTTAYGLAWTNSIMDPGFTHSNATNTQNIILDAVGDYLVHVNLPLSGAVTNGNVKVVLNLNGSPVIGGEAKQGYISATGTHTQSSVHWSGMVRAASANAILTITAQLEGAAGTIAVPAGRTASLFVERLGSTSGVFYGYGTSLVSGADFNAATASPITLTTEPVRDTSTFTHSTVSNSHQVTVLSAGDYLVMFNSAESAAAARVNAIKKILVNGVAISGAEGKTGYIRNTAGHTEASESIVFLLRRLNANDIISVTSQSEANVGAVTSSNASLVVVKKP